MQCGNRETGEQPIVNLQHEDIETNKSLGFVFSYVIHKYIQTIIIYDLLYSTNYGWHNTIPFSKFYVYKIAPQASFLTIITIYALI